MTQESYRKEEFVASRFNTPNGTVAYLDAIGVFESKFSILNQDGTKAYYLQKDDKFMDVTGKVI